MKRLFLCVLILAACSGQVWSQEIPKTGFRADFLSQMDELGQKLVSLAEAVPQEKYTYKPANGVRGVSEVFMHVASGNYFLTKLIGFETPANFNRDMEKTVTDKAKVVETLKASLEHVRQAILRTTDGDLDKPAEFFGQKTTVRNIFYNVTVHCAEHLGQSIAYARMNGVTPPWSKTE